MGFGGELSLALPVLGGGTGGPGPPGEMAVESPSHRAILQAARGVLLECLA